MSVYRKRAPNINLVIPDWDEPCADVLRLPGMLLENGNEGYYRIAADGPMGKAAEELFNLWKGYCRSKQVAVRRADGTSEDGEMWHPDEDLLVGKLYGQAFDPDMRIAFARCLLEIDAYPAEVIAIGERVYAKYVQEEADRMTARTIAGDKVERRYGELLPQYIDGKVLEAFRKLLITLTVALGHAPEVLGVMGMRRELFIALPDVEAFIQRRLPRGAQLPEYVSKMGRRCFLTLNALALFGLSELRDWYFEDEDNERVADLYFGLNGLQYQLMKSNTEGRRVLNNMMGGLFGGAIESDPE